jgi:hypothetical protein
VSELITIDIPKNAVITRNRWSIKKLKMMLAMMKVPPKKCVMDPFEFIINMVAP